MPQRPPDDPGLSIVRDHTERPPGALPRRTQQYIVLGIALLITLIALFSGHAAKPAAHSAARSLPDPQPPNASEISAYQQQLRQLQMAAEKGTARTPLPNDVAPMAPPTGSEATTAASATAAANPMVQQQQKRMYESLFASNIALSYRQRRSSSAPASAVPPANSLDAQIRQALAAGGLTAVAPRAAPASATPAAKPATDQAASLRRTTRQAAADSAGKLYVLTEGTIVPTVLLNRLVGDLPGPVECMVSSDIYAPDLRHILIPGGSRVLGEAKPVSAFGQQRLAVEFDRLILPDGASFMLDDFAGLNQSGATGLHDKVNNHYLRIFGASMAIGLLGGAAEIAATPADANGRGLYIEGVGSGLSQASMQVLDKFLNVMPTITIREGHRVAIYLTRDLLLPAYPAAAADR